MFKILKYYLLKPFFIWLIIFAFFKSFFIVFNWDLVSSENIGTILQVFSKSLKLDISSACYILIIPFFLSIIQFFTSSNIVKKVSKIYFLIVLLFISIINVIDIVLYSYWFSKISLKSFMFLTTPKQIIEMIGFQKFAMVILFILFHFIVGKKFFNKYFNRKLTFSKSIISLIFFSLFSAVLIIVGIRGGIQVVPINQSSSYYSTNNTLNVAGVNPLWNFMNTLIQNGSYANTNPYIKMESKEAEEYVKALYTVKKDTTIKLFDIEKPNIIFITLEGVNANVFKAYNKDKTYAPNIEKLFSEGYLFTELYAAGFRSDQGMISIFGGFPPTPVSSICAQPEKFSKLPSFSKKLQEEGYDCSFFSGGETAFGNFKSYLVYNDFEPLIEVFDFPEEQRTQNLGAPDEFIFKKFTNDIEGVVEPFYSMIFTLTTHEPYDMPFNEGVKDESVKYLNTVLYVDSVLAKWYHEMKTMPWYDNTIFIITADHAHFHPFNYDNWVNERYHIPFLILGEPLKEEFKGKENHKICSQIDISKSILAQLDIENDDFKWSKNFMNPYVKEFAFYTFVEGAVLKTKNNTSGYEYNWNKPLGNDSSYYLKQSQAYLQVLYDDYLSK